MAWFDVVGCKPLGLDDPLGFVLVIVELARGIAPVDVQGGPIGIICIIDECMHYDNSV